MSSVICLDDSSDDEAVPAVARLPAAKSKSASIPSRRKKPAPTSTSSNNEVVELLNDDSDEEVHNNGEDDDWLKEQIELAKRASLTTQTTQNSTKEKQPNRVSLGKSPLKYDSDSDLDDSILAPFNMMKKKCKSTESIPQRNVSLSQGSNSTTASAARIVNPYAKKTPNKVSTSIHTTTPSNPYTTTQKKPTPTIANPYGSAKKKTPPPASTSFNNIAHTDGNSASFPTEEYPYPKLSKKSRSHEDIRARALLALWKSARSLTLNSYQGQKLDNTIKKIVSLALWPYPLRSLEEFITRPKASTTSDGNFKLQLDELNEQLSMGKYKEIRVPVAASQGGRYCSIAEACLVVMATEIDRRCKNSPENRSKPLKEQLASKENYISLSFLIPEIDKNLHPSCPAGLLRQKDEDGGLEYYTKKCTRSAEYAQIEKLSIICPTHKKDVHAERNNGIEGYIKRRMQKKQVVFELSPLGYETAKWIEGRVFPAPAGHYRTSHIASLAHVKPEHRDICIGVDFREGGLKRRTLHEMCNKLDMKGIPYFVGSIDVGDYCFFWTKPGPDQGKLCPIFVERKSIEDLAQSIADGRWKSQKHRMYHAQHVMGYDNCRICYIIEGKLEKQLVSGDYVGHRKFNVTKEAIDQAIEGLEAEGFEVLRTSVMENSMFELTRWAARVAEEVRSGKLTVQYTYAEFKEEVKGIPRDVDFSRIAKDHMARRKEKEAEATQRVHPKEDYKDPSPNSRRGSNLSSTASANPRAVRQVDNEAIDLCSDDDDDTRPVKTSSLTQEPSKTVRSIKKSRNIQAANVSRFPTPPEVAAHFNIDDSEDDSDDEMAEAQKIIREKKRKEEKRKKRKLEEAASQTSSKRASGVAGKDAKNKTGEEAGPLDDVKEETVSGGYETWSIAQLKEKCEEYGLKKSGTKAQLIELLQGPKPPRVWVDRKKAGQYVPARHNVAGTALLVALYLHERNVGSDALGMSKDELYSKAEELEITENPFSGGTTQTGPYHYDGWASMKYLMEGDPPLVNRMKHHRYRLTRNGGDMSGFALAKAMHKWCHEHNNCNCGSNVAD